MGEQGVQDETKHSHLISLRVEGQRGGGVVAYPYHMGPARQEVQDLVAEGGVQNPSPHYSSF